MINKTGIKITGGVVFCYVKSAWFHITPLAEKFPQLLFIIPLSNVRKDREEKLRRKWKTIFPNNIDREGSILRSTFKFLSFGEFQCVFCENIYDTFPSFEVFAEHMIYHAGVVRDSIGRRYK